MKTDKWILTPALLLLALLTLAAAGAVPAAEPLATVFKTPPHAARPWVYWFWMNGNVTREGITADLEAMTRVGVGGVLIMSVSNGIPPGRVDFMSPQWRELFAHAVREAGRLGLEINMNNDDGWTGSGGPWNTPENSMQILTWSETRVQGGAMVDVALPRPPARLEHYRDIAVFALPAAGPAMREQKPQITCDQPRFLAWKLMDDNLESGVLLPKPTAGKPVVLGLEFERPFMARSLTLLLGAGRQNHGGRLEASEDGLAFREVKKFDINGVGENASFGTSFAPVTARFFRLVFDREAPMSNGVAIQELELCAEARLEDWPAQSGRCRAERFAPADAALPVASREAVHELTRSMDDTGRLRWQAPEGRWLIVRLGHTTTGKSNHPATPAGTGLECDKLSRAAVEAHFGGMLAKLIADAGPLAGKALVSTHVDSWEVGSQNWTPGLLEEFRARRGYDARPWLPVMLGYPVESVEASERFLYDMRLTLGDLIADNYVCHLRTLAKRHGLGLSIEAYGNGNFNNLQCAARADMPMSEFWVGKPGRAERGKEPASVAHQLGLPFVGAEAFTANPDKDRWTQHPYAIKALGDEAFCAGINRLVFHRYAMQPWMDRLPGMTFGPHGIHFERTNTWFEQSRAWLDYLSRCQALLQRGKFVADLLYFTGESVPLSMPSRGGLKPAPPDGYDYDGCSAEMLLRHATVRDGRIVFPGGVAYRLLILPPEAARMTPAVLGKIHELVQAGAHVLGSRPERSPSLAGYPACDGEVARLAEALWGPAGQAAGERAIGRGKVFWGRSVEQVLDTLDLTPDVDWAAAEDASALRWIHRSVDGAEVYFVANLANYANAVDATFRVTGLKPEIWDPASGDMSAEPLWTRGADGRATVRLRLDPRGSIFVVFAETGEPRFSAIERAGAAVGEKTATPALRILKATYGVPGDARRTRDVTAKVAALAGGGTLAVKAWIDLSGGDPAPHVVKTLRVDYILDGKEQSASVQDGEVLRLGTAREAAPPDGELVRRGGGLRLRVWRADSFTLRTAGAEPLGPFTAPGLPEPMRIAGPWQVDFPPHLGAPTSATFAELISWSEHPDDGIRHFSGTATYRGRFELPASAIGKPMLLDLGAVEVMAEVILNGRNLGVLWKAPFRVEITDAARSGENQLELRVTNLWPNRLIGDERHPPAIKFIGGGSGGRPGEWPDWVMDGGPVPATGRVTFTTWMHYNKGTALLPSGLLGPVTVRVGEEWTLN